MSRESASVTNPPSKGKKPPSKDLLGHIFDSRVSSYQHLINKVYALEGINQVFQSAIDENLSEHCTVANIRDNTLVLEMDNSSWATRLRYEIPDILQKIHSQPGLECITHIEFYVKPPATEAKQPSKRRITMGQHSADSLRSIAEQIQNETLRGSLQGLADNSEAGIK